MMPAYILPPSLQQLANSIRDKSMYRKVKQVQLFFNRYRYFMLPDKRRFLTPTELDAAGGGDCKAQAATKYLVLLAAGVPMDQLWLVATRRESDRAPHMVLVCGDRVLDLLALTYTIKGCPYIPKVGINHQSRGICEGAAEAWFGFGRREDVIWDFTWYSFNTRFWRLMHVWAFWKWDQFNKKLEEEMKLGQSFAEQLQPSPFERAVAEVGVIPDTTGVSPETQAELTALITQAGGQLSPALFAKMSERVRVELAEFTRRNQAGLLEIYKRMGAPS